MLNEIISKLPNGARSSITYIDFIPYKNIYINVHKANKYLNIREEMYQNYKGVSVCVQLISNPHV